MDDTTSEATSPHSASEYSSMYNQSNHTYQWHFQQQQNEGMTHSQATQDQFLQGDASRQPRPGGRRTKLSEHEKRERIKLNNVNYRLRKKGKVNEMTALIQSLQDENRRLHLENKHMEELIRGLRCKGQLPGEVPERQDSYISQPTSQVDQQNVYVQDHYEMESNNDERVYIGHHFMEYSHNEGAADELFNIDELLNPISRENELTTIGTVDVNEPVNEHPECSQSVLCPIEVTKIKLQKFLAELDAEVTSNVHSSDFTDLEGEQRRFGRFSFPVSLIPTVERINDVHGDVSEKCLISPSISGTIYVLFCATIREMEHLQLEQVTESIMLKWRDVIKDALRLNFSVKFAMQHLKKIACAYFGLSEHLRLLGIDAKISTLEAEVNDWKKKRTMIYEESKISIDATEKFIGVPVSTGLFSRSSSSRIMHG